MHGHRHRAVGDPDGRALRVAAGDRIGRRVRRDNQRRHRQERREGIAGQRGPCEPPLEPGQPRGRSRSRNRHPEPADVAAAVADQSEEARQLATGPGRAHRRIRAGRRIEADRCRRQAPGDHQPGNDLHEPDPGRQQSSRHLQRRFGRACLHEHRRRRDHRGHDVLRQRRLHRRRIRRTRRHRPRLHRPVPAQRLSSILRRTVLRRRRMRRLLRGLRRRRDVFRGGSMPAAHRWLRRRRPRTGTERHRASGERSLCARNHSRDARDDRGRGLVQLDRERRLHLHSEPVARVLRSRASRLQDLGDRPAVVHRRRAGRHPTHGCGGSYVARINTSAAASASYTLTVEQTP